MTEEKFGKWIALAERIILLLRPKFHNTLTKVVVIFGLTISVESQINIIEAFSVALFEHFFGPSEFLRNLFANNSNPWVGVIFVVFGLVYNAVVNVGLELVKTYKAAIPKKPDLSLSILNSDSESLGDRFVLRGKTCNVPPLDEIPDNHSYSEVLQKKHEKDFVQIGRIRGTSSPVFGRATSLLEAQVNKDFYRERAKFLKTWGGAEILTLCIENAGEVICRNIQVKLKIPKKKGVVLDNTNKLKPDFPSQETEETLYSLSRLTPQQNLHPLSYDITSSHTNSHYCFDWKAGDLQAKNHTSSRTKLFIRVEDDTDIEATIYCDELSDPITKLFMISPPSETENISLKTIQLRTRDFFENINELIMDGYLDRYCQNIFEEMNGKKEAPRHFEWN